MSSISNPLIDSLISQFEGFGTSNAPSITNGNNPGAIQFGSFAQGYGSTSAAPNGAAIFPSLTSGEQALDDLVSNKIASGLNTPTSLIGSWAPATAAGNSTASTNAYINSVATGLGIGVNDTIPSSGTSQSTSGTTDTTPTGSVVGSIGTVLGNIPGGSILSGLWNFGASNASSANAALSWFNGLSLEQVVTVLIGAALLIIGIFFLRPVQNFTNGAISTAKKGVALVS